MATDGPVKSFEKSEIASSDLDLAQIVGHEIILFSDQFPGERLAARILDANNGAISISRGSGDGLVDELTTSQGVFIQFSYRGQRVSVRSTVKRTSTGKCTLLLHDNVIPLHRRQFNRMRVDGRVKMAVMPISGLNAARMNRLRWLETGVVNISSGGAMIMHTSPLSRDAQLFMSFDIEGIPLPSLLMARVCHADMANPTCYHVGVEFIVREACSRLFPITAVRQLPPTALEYTSKRRSNVNKEITNLMQEQRG